MQHPQGEERIHAAEVIAALSLATDLGIGVRWSTGCRARCGDSARRAPWCRLGDGVADLLCVPAVLRRLHRRCGIAAETFGDDDALTTYATGQVRVAAECDRVLRALANRAARRGWAVQIARACRGRPGSSGPSRCVLRGGTDVGRAARSARFDAALFAYLVERWDGKGVPGRARREGIPLPVRIASWPATPPSSACWAAGVRRGVVRERAGGAFDPAVAVPLADEAPEILALERWVGLGGGARLRARPAVDPGG